MSGSGSTFDEALFELEQIAVQAKQPDLELDELLALLDKGATLANICTEKTDHTLWRDAVKGDDGGDQVSREASPAD